MNTLSRRDFLRGVLAVVGAGVVGKVMGAITDEAESVPESQHAMSPWVDMPGPEYLQSVTTDSLDAIRSCDLHCKWIAGRDGILLISPDEGETWTEA